MSKRRFKRSIPIVATVGPVVIWLILLVAIPLIYVLVLSFMKARGYDLYYTPNVDNYIKLTDPIYVNIYKNSILIAVLTTVLCILLGYPFAYKMARATKKKQAFMMILLMIPFWTNSLIRLYGWRTFLGKTGLLNSFLKKIGLIEESIPFLFNQGAVLFGMVYTLLPFMVLPIYSAIEKMDWSLLEASSDLGARTVRTFFKVTIPLTSSGIASGVIMTFIPCLGYYFVSDIMGGGSNQLIGNIIEDSFKSGNNWPLGSAFSIALILLTLIMVSIYKKLGGKMENLI